MSDNFRLAGCAYLREEKVTADLGVEGQCESVTDPKFSSQAHQMGAGGQERGLFE